MSRLYLRSGKLLHLAQSNTIHHNHSKLSPAQISAPFSPRTVLGLTSPTPVSPLSTTTSINARIASSTTPTVISPLSTATTTTVPSVNPRVVSTTSSIYSLFPPPPSSTPIRASTASSVYSVPSMYIPAVTSPLPPKPLPTIQDVAPSAAAIKAKARAAPPPPLVLDPPTPPPKSPLYPAYTVETPGSGTGTPSDRDMFRFAPRSGVPPPAPTPPMGTPLSAVYTPVSGFISAFGGLKFPHRRGKEDDDHERELVISSPIMGSNMANGELPVAKNVEGKEFESVFPNEKIWPRTPLKNVF